MPAGLRILEAVAGLLTAGLLLLGLVLLASRAWAPSALGGDGIARAQGPALDRAIVPTVLGVLGEAARLFSKRLPVAGRYGLAGAAMVAAASALWWMWWR